MVLLLFQNSPSEKSFCGLSDQLKNSEISFQSTCATQPCSKGRRIREVFIWETGQAACLLASSAAARACFANSSMRFAMASASSAAFFASTLRCCKLSLTCSRALACLLSCTSTALRSSCCCWKNIWKNACALGTSSLVLVELFCSICFKIWARCSSRRPNCSSFFLASCEREEFKPSKSSAALAFSAASFSACAAFCCACAAALSKTAARESANLALSNDAGSLYFPSPPYPLSHCPSKPPSV
mmetsp:Transcript_35357/g.89881  ORF Transcript_35357/g.89881 Transcript_35357/m.89881 type:complete len:244 (+) Transcript_35357:134-865(+)